MRDAPLFDPADDPHRAAEHLAHPLFMLAIQLIPQFLRDTFQCIRHIHPSLREYMAGTIGVSTVGHNEIRYRCFETLCSRSVFTPAGTCAARPNLTNFSPRRSQCRAA